jgi:transglutaminase-like putative cysteine protease
MKQYLLSSEYIDSDHPAVIKQAAELVCDCHSEEEKVKACFEFVRDHIKHSWDYRLNPLTCRASDVLKHGTGFCYAKSHLLAALLRSIGIPAGLCYQRLTIDGESGPYCLHGLNAVYLQRYGWYRLDARGNKVGVDAQFAPPLEQLAFSINHENEGDLPGIWPEPLPMIVDALTCHASVEEVASNLPDIPLDKFNSINNTGA